MLAAKTGESYHAHAHTRAHPAVRRVKIQKVHRIKIDRKKLLDRVRITGILLCLMTANILVQALLAKTQHQLGIVRGEIQELEKDVGRLQYELADLSSSERIEVIAVNALGMKPAENDSRQLLSYSSALPETPEITLYMQTPYYLEMDRGVMERVTDWFSGVGRVMADPGY